MIKIFRNNLIVIKKYLGNLWQKLPPEVRNEYVLLWAGWIVISYSALLVENTTAAFYTKQIFIYCLLVFLYLSLSARDICFKRMKSLLLLLAAIGCTYNLMVHIDYKIESRVFYDSYPYYMNRLNDLELSVLIIGTIIRIFQIGRFSRIFVFGPIYNLYNSVIVFCRDSLHKKI